MAFRSLTEPEIGRLTAQGCSAQAWSAVRVKDGFTTDRVEQVRFEGTVSLGIFKEAVAMGWGDALPSGLYRSRIRNCDIGDSVHVSDVKDLAGYTVHDGAALVNVGTIVVDRETSFGNGVEIEVLNEGGGRELPIFDRLSAQVAYLLVMYRHDSALVNRLRDLVAAYARSRLSSTGAIGAGSRIVNCSVIRNVAMGPKTNVAGALLLEEGTIASSEHDPTSVGEGVVARQFVILSGSTVDGCAMLTRCFVGQGCRIGRQFSATNSAFFANCEAFHGEACSVFAGPYTVTHHKSTLLIAGFFSFYNAGSGTNQSNHMYKLGPVHQGIVERGVKTGSFSYLLWPARVGAFTAVIGKHFANFDTSDFPFSYIMDAEGRSVLTPAMNLFTVGTQRDCAKWSARDRRSGPDALDLVSFARFSPYVVGKMLRGIHRLRLLYESTPASAEYARHSGISIKRLLLKTSAKYYELGVKIYIGDALAARLERLGYSVSMADVRKVLRPAGADGAGDWVDVCGLFAPAAAVREVAASIASGKLAEIEEIAAALRRLHENYAEMSWTWCVALIEQRAAASIDVMSAAQLAHVVRDWEESCVVLNNMILKDAEKEFGQSSAIGFGIDGDEATKADDFKAVRGTCESTGFVIGLRKESAAVRERAAKLLAMLKKIP